MKVLHYLSSAVAFAVLVLVGSCANRSGVQTGEKDIVLNDTLTRSALVKMDVLTQHNVFSDLSPEKKYELYDYKLKSDLESSKLTDAEKQILRDLRKHLSVKVYSDADAGDEFRNYGKSVEQKLREECGWDDEKMFIYTETIMTAEEAEPVVEAKKKVMKN